MERETKRETVLPCVQFILCQLLFQLLFRHLVDDTVLDRELFVHEVAVQTGPCSRVLSQDHLGLVPAPLADVRLFRLTPLAVRIVRNRFPLRGRSYDAPFPMPVTVGSIGCLRSPVRARLLQVGMISKLQTKFQKICVK